MSYPKVFLRIKGMLLDSLIFSILLFSSVFLLLEFGIENTALKALFVIAPLLLFEPLCIHFSGGSIGHHYAGIKVVNAKTGRNLSIILSLIRFVIKVPLGIASLLSMLVTKKHQAIHDYLSNSVVTFKSGYIVPEHHKLAERQSEGKSSILRRLVVALAFSLMWLIVISVVMNFAVSSECVNSSLCSRAEITRLNLVSMMALAVVLVIFILGLICKLPGTKK